MSRTSIAKFISHIKFLANRSLKISLFLIVLVAIANIFISSIHKSATKQSITLVNSYKQDQKVLYDIIKEANLSDSQGDRVMGKLFAQTTCKAIGEGCTNNPDEADYYYGRSLLGNATSLMLLPYTSPPASFIYYAYHNVSDFGFLPDAYAADGVGFSSLNSLVNTWKIFRDIAYFLVVVVIVFVGFLIMFKTKINPQTVISIENTIPRLIITLIYITFSFAIVGLLVDLMYVLIGIVVSLMAGAAGIDAAKATSQYMTSRPGGIWMLLNRNQYVDWDILWTVPNALFNLMPTLGLFVKYAATGLGVWRGFPWIWDHFFAPLSGLFNIDPSITIGFGITLDGFLESIVNIIIKPGVLVIAIFLFAHYIVPFAIGLLILFTVISLCFRIIAMLLKSYITLLIMTMLSPLILLEEIIPGKSAFSNWFKTIVSELIVFPSLILIMFVASLIIDSATAGTLLQLPFLYGIDPKSFSIIIGMIVLFMMPDLVKKIKERIQPKPMGISGGLGTLFTGATGAIGAAMAIPTAKSLFMEKLPHKILPPGLATSLLGRTAEQVKSDEHKGLATAIKDAMQPNTTPPAGPGGPPQHP